MRQLPDSLYYAYEALHLYNIDAPNHEIYLTGEEDRPYDDNEEPGVEYAMATRFIKNLRFCVQHDPKKPILIHMKTNGGYWEEGMAIYDAIKSCPSYVTVLNYTHARSMSSIILQAADYRLMMPHATFMFHDGTWATSGTLKQVYTEIDFNKKVADPAMIKIYVDSLKHDGKFKGWSRPRIAEMLRDEMNKKEDVYLTAQEAVDWGFADEIFEGDWEALK
jgi:ATP-dependent protease ClpP protease subunit